MVDLTTEGPDPVMTGTRMSVDVTPSSLKTSTVVTCSSLHNDKGKGDMSHDDRGWEKWCKGWDLHGEGGEVHRGGTERSRGGGEGRGSGGSGQRNPSHVAPRATL
jgi:hypothetical protein